MNLSAQEARSLDLTQCDREKIHQIPYIQGHGTFIEVGITDFKIKKITANLSQFFDRSEKSEHWLGKNLNELLNFELSLQLQQITRTEKIKAGFSRTFVFKGTEILDVYLYYISSQTIGVEFEKLQTEQEALVDGSELNQILIRMKNSATLEELSRYACAGVRALTGMERVMIYRFFPPSMFGEVIAEDRTAEAHSFLHHRFPASDIPKPARDLYLRNAVRFIYDSEASTEEIYPKISPENVPLDLSDSKLRGVSLIHIEYLKNMKVRGSLSVAIIVKDKLWGIISCHGHKPRPVSHGARSGCQLIGNILALSIPIVEENKEQGKRLHFYTGLHELFTQIKKANHPLDEMFRQGELVKKLFDCTGFALIEKNKVDFFGITPQRQELKKIGEWLIQRMDESHQDVFHTESLSQLDSLFGPLKELVSGVLALKINEIEQSLLVFMRPEVLQEVEWGGDPRKNMEERNYQGIINPRASFETWTEIIKHTATPWENFEIEGAQYFKDLIFDSLVRKEQLIHELSTQLEMLKKPRQSDG